MWVFLSLGRIQHLQKIPDSRGEFQAGKIPNSSFSCPFSKPALTLSSFSCGNSGSLPFPREFLLQTPNLSWKTPFNNSWMNPWIPGPGTTGLGFATFPKFLLKPWNYWGEKPTQLSADSRKKPQTFPGAFWAGKILGKMEFSHFLLFPFSLFPRCREVPASLDPKPSGKATEEWIPPGKPPTKR